MIRRVVKISIDGEAFYVATVEDMNKTVEYAKGEIQEFDFTKQKYTAEFVPEKQWDKSVFDMENDETATMRELVDQFISPDTPIYIIGSTTWD